MKKGIELSQMCDLDIAIIIRDREMDKITQYCSGSQEKGMFTIDEVVKALQKEEYLDRNVKLYNDNDYNSLKTKPKVRKNKNKKDEDDDD